MRLARRASVLWTKRWAFWVFGARYYSLGHSPSFAQSAPTLRPLGIGSGLVSPFWAPSFNNAGFWFVWFTFPTQRMATMTWSFDQVYLHNHCIFLRTSTCYLVENYTKYYTGPFDLRSYSLILLHKLISAAHRVFSWHFPRKKGYSVATSASFHLLVVLNCSSIF